MTIPCHTIQLSEHQDLLFPDLLLLPEVRFVMEVNEVLAALLPPDLLPIAELRRDAAVEELLLPLVPFPEVRFAVEVEDVLAALLPDLLPFPELR